MVTKQPKAEASSALSAVSYASIHVTMNISHTPKLASKSDWTFSVTAFTFRFSEVKLRPRRVTPHGQALEELLLPGLPQSQFLRLQGVSPRQTGWAPCSFFFLFLFLPLLVNLLG